jgi:hypothetical protein
MPLAKVTVQVGVVTTRGDVSADAVRSAVIQREPALLCCHATRVRKDAELEGHFSVELVVDALGQPFTARTIGDSFHREDIIGCVRDELLGLTLPRDRAGRASVPILFLLK